MAARWASLARPGNSIVIKLVPQMGLAWPPGRACPSHGVGITAHHPSGAEQVNSKAEYRSCLTQTGAKPSFDSHLACFRQPRASALRPPPPLLNVYGTAWVPPWDRLRFSLKTCVTSSVPPWDRLALYLDVEPKGVAPGRPRWPLLGSFHHLGGPSWEASTISIFCSYCDEAGYS